MSEECCGPDEPRKTRTVRRIELSHPLTTGDACCDPGNARTTADTPTAARKHDDGDACCGPDPATIPIDTNAGEIEVRPPWWRDTALLPSAIAGVFLLTGYILEWTGVPIPALIFQAIALIAGAYTFVPGAIRRLLRGRLGVGLLMTIAAVGAVLLGHVGEAAALAFLFSLAEALEDRAMDRAKEGLRALLSLIPATVRISRLGGDVTIPAADVRELDILVVGAGERIATDGVVVEGRSSLDASAVTGESIPVEVGPADEVTAGSVNGSVTLRIEATANGRDNSLTQIVALVEQAHARKGDRARLADRIARRSLKRDHEQNHRKGGPELRILGGSDDLARRPLEVRGQQRRHAGDDTRHDRRSRQAHQHPSPANASGGRRDEAHTPPVDDQ